MYNMFAGPGAADYLTSAAAPQTIQEQNPYWQFSPEYQQIHPLISAMHQAQGGGMGSYMGAGGAATGAAQAGMTGFEKASLGMMGAGSVLDFIGGIMQGKAAKKESKKNRSLARDQMAAQQASQNAQLFQNLYQLLLQGRQGVR